MIYAFDKYEACLEKLIFAYNHDLTKDICL